MSISEAGGISDEMTVEFTPGPVHPPAMTTVELRVVVTMPTSAWVSGDFSSESIRQRHDRFRWLHDNKSETVASVTACYVQRRFEISAITDGAWNGYEVLDLHNGDHQVCTFEREDLAQRLADTLEKNPSIIDGGA